MADTIVLYEDPDGGGERKTGIRFDIPDLTLAPVNFPNGASSMAIGAEAGRWEVFTKPNYDGQRNILEPGVEYMNLQAMGLPAPVRSMRRV